MTTAVHVLATPDEERKADVAGGAPVELTVAFTDLEDFTTYTEAEGDDAASRMLIGHRRESEAIVRSRSRRAMTDRIDRRGHIALVTRGRCVQQHDVAY